MTSHDDSEGRCRAPEEQKCFRPVRVFERCYRGAQAGRRKPRLRQGPSSKRSRDYAEYWAAMEQAERAQGPPGGCCWISILRKRRLPLASAKARHRVDGYY